MVETFGSTSLTQVGDNFYLGASGPQLKSGGAAVMASQYGGWAPIATEATASGYEVAWKLAGTNLYTVWNTDSSGNTTANTAVLSATSTALELLEPSFHQDLNGDGTIGLPTKVIESFGSTSLTQVGDNFYLGASGPLLKSAGAAVMASQYGGWAPIATEATASGYEVAWKLAGTNLYTIWNTDSSGNTTANTAVLSATNTALELLETSFHQDLNGDGTIGLPTKVIESFGSTSLTQVGDNFYLGASGPLLKSGGAAVMASQYGGWAPIATEATASGYEVAWKLAGTNLYTIWNTDGSGNTTANTAVLSATSTALELLEPSFHQDLNGDGTIGLPTTRDRKLWLDQPDPGRR